MLKVGLTGGMACGKSSVAAMFARLGAQIIDADKLVHQLMRPGETVYAEIVAHFGADILGSDGTIDRVKLAAKAFSPVAPGQTGGSKPHAQRTRIEELNRIVHPAVIRRQEEWMEQVGRQDPNAVAIVEAALIFEAGVGKRFDRLVVVTCGAEKKLERFAQRANLSVEAAREELGRRSAAQWSDEEKARRADYVIDNSGSLVETERQVEQVWRELHSQARRSSSPS